MEIMDAVVAFTLMLGITVQMIELLMAQVKEFNQNRSLPILLKIKARTV